MKKRLIFNLCQILKNKNFFFKKYAISQMILLFSEIFPQLSVQNGQIHDRVYLDIKDK